MPENAEVVKDVSKFLDSTHENKWVAISPDYTKLLGASPNLSELETLVSGSNAIFYFVNADAAKKKHRTVELDLWLGTQHQKFLVLIDPTVTQIIMPPSIAQMFGADIFDVD